jgi:hypothetical protein
MIPARTGVPEKKKFDEGKLIQTVFQKNTRNLRKMVAGGKRSAADLLH